MQIFLLVIYDDASQHCILTQNLLPLSIKHQEKSDVYDLGVILFEMIVGRPFNTRTEVEFVKDQVRVVQYC